MASVEPQTSKARSSRRRRRGLRRAKGAEDRDAGGVEGVANGEGVSPSPADYVVWGSVVNSPSGVRCRAPAKKKRFYCFLSVSEHLSLQRLLKINVVHNRPLVENKKLSYRRGTARCVVSVEILPMPIATQQCRNYVYEGQVIGLSMQSPRGALFL